MYKYQLIRKGDWKKYGRQILKLEKQCFPPEEKTDASWWIDLIQGFKGTIGRVLIHNEKVVALYICSPLELCGKSLMKWDKNYGECNTLYLINIMVSPEYKNQGIAQTLIYLMAMDAKENNYERLTLHTNNPALGHILTKTKFKKTETSMMEGNMMQYYVKRLE
jgi:ribosomal protein S18 acetylase RimI-like enzyme